MNNQTWLVAKNIYRNRIKGVGFWALVISPFLLSAIYLVIGLLISSGMNQTPQMAVVANPALAQVLKADQNIKADISNEPTLSQAEHQLSAGKIDGFLTEENGKYTLVTDSRSGVKFDQTSFQSALTQVNISNTAARLSLSAEDVKSLLSPAHLTIKTQTKSGQTTGGDARTGANIAIGSIASILIFALMMMYVGIIGQEIGNEKSSRIMETLLAATSSNVQYYGKIIGVILLLATQIGIYIAGFAAAYPFIRNLDQIKAISEMLTGITVGFGVYLVLMSLVGILGYLILASIVASLVNEQAQVQQATQPIAFLAMVGYIGGIAGATVPGNLILRVLSFIPFVSPTLMTSRFAIQYSTPAEAWIAFLLQLLATLAIAKAGEKIYARNVLSYSDEKIFGQLIKSITGRDLKNKKIKEQVTDKKKNIWRKNSPLRLVIALLIILAVLLYRFILK
ncbi:ABC transporter permease [Lactococcus kimchii]|uniref:ABC transporter permease n=1 Tax=Lactococcus sp. S-13 TaxID=2507158 RepID=UPI001022B3D9|nr:ABC transporter permease [Lactococcus sp. S-13]RZI48980.1 ABC transporter permease [Lactococcus sp. S-13]